MKVNFYFVRHGETLFNSKGRIQGVCDSPLSANGLKQVEKAGEALKSVYFHKAFTSPSERCMDTARAVLAGRNIEPLVIRNLHEASFGKFEGSRFTSHTDEIRYCFDHRDFSNVGGESPTQLVNRAKSVFEEMILRCKDQDNVLVVSHGYFEFFVMHALLGVDLDAYEKECQAKGRNPIPNAGIMAFSYEDGKYEVINLPTDPYDYVPSPIHKTLHFYYVRHGQTVFNMYNRMQGWSDSPLTEMGKDQAATAGRALADVKFTSAYVSSSQRTRDTAAIILQGRGMHPVVTRGLKEVNFGEYEGVVTDSWREEVMRRHMDNENWKDAGGEDGDDVRARMLNTLNKIVSRAKDGDTILLVSHGTYYMNMLWNLFGLNRQSLEQRLRSEGKQPMPNGGIFRFDYVNGSYELVELMVSPDEYLKRKEAE